MPLNLSDIKQGKKRAKRERGASFFIFLMMLSVLVSLGALVLDGSRYFQARAQLSRGLEAAVQAGSAQGSCDEVAARAYLQRYFDNMQKISLTSVSLECAQETVMKGVVKVDGWILPELEIESLDRQITLRRNNDKLVEIAMVVDVSGSMGTGNRIADLRAGMQSFISSLPQLPSGKLKDARVAIIPFASGVIHQRMDGGVDCYNPSSLTSSPLVRAQWEAMMGAKNTEWPDKLRYGTNNVLGDGCETSQSLFLTDDATRLMESANQLDDGGSTDIELGVIWGWRAIDPRWLLYKSESAISERYGQAKKIMILFTDADAITGTQLTENGNDSLCGSIKRRNIELFTIKLGSSYASSVMQTCATSPAHYQASPSSGELKQIFNNIASKIGTKIELSL